MPYQNLDMEIKEKIVSKTSELFFIYGIKNVTMDMLASELGISKRTIYEIFNDKENLVIECLDYLFTKQNEDRMEIIKSSDNMVHAMFEIFRIQMNEHKNLPKILMEDIKKYIPIANERLFSKENYIKERSSTYFLIERGKQEGLIRPEINPELVDAFLMELFPFIMNNDRIKFKMCNDLEMSVNIIFPYFRGLATNKGIKMMETYFESIDIDGEENALTELKKALNPNKISENQ